MGGRDLRISTPTGLWELSCTVSAQSVHAILWCPNSLAVLDPGKPRHCPGKILVNFAYCFAQKLGCEIAAMLCVSSAWVTWQLWNCRCPNSCLHILHEDIIYNWQCSIIHTILQLHSSAEWYFTVVCYLTDTLICHFSTSPLFLWYRWALFSMYWQEVVYCFHTQQEVVNHVSYKLSCS